MYGYTYTGRACSTILDPIVVAWLSLDYQFSGSSGAKSKSVTISDFSSLKRTKSFISIRLDL